MASISGRGAKGHHTYTFTLTETGTSIANNTSTVSYSFDLTDDANWFWEGWNNSITYSVSANGSVLASGSIPNHTTKSQNIAKGTFSVPHNADGSKSISYSFSVSDGANQYYTSGNASASGTMALTTIPRASTVSAVSGTTIGGQMTVTIARAVSTFTHQLWYKVGSSAWYDLGKGIGTSKSFTIDLATANQFPNAMSGNLQLCVRTFNGATTIGSDTYHNVTVSVPSYTPTISNIKLTGNNLLSGEFVHGKSTLSVEITANSLYGATIRTYSSAIDRKNYSGNKFTTAALSSVNTNVFVTVTDSRGISATKWSNNIVVREYSNPTITEFTLARQSDGTTVIATVKGTVAAVNNKNAKTIQVTLNGVTQTITSSSYTINGTTTFTNVPTDNTLTSVAKITDSYTHVTREFVLPTVAVTMDFLYDGKGIAMGKVAETTDLLDVAWNERVRKNLTVNGTHTVGGNATVGGTFTATGATTLNKVTTISDTDWKTLILKRVNAIGAVTIQFQNNTGSLGFIGMTGEELNTPLRRWTSDGATAYTVLDTGFTKDHVVEQGTSGIWTYRKWNSGLAECFGSQPVTNMAVATVWGALYCSARINLPNFPFTFKSVPQVNLSWNATYTALIDGALGVTTTSSGYTFIFRADSVTLSGSVAIQAIGKWK